MAKITAADMITAIKGMNRQEKRAFSKALSDADIDLGGGSSGGKSIKDRVMSTPGVSSTVKTANDLLKTLGNIDDINKNPFGEIADDINQLTRETQNFFKTGYTGQMFDFSKSISAATKASRDLTGGIQGAQQVMRGFSQNSKILMVSSQGMQEQLMKTSVVLNEAGFDMGDFAEILDSAAFSFNMNKTEIESLTATLINVQREIPVSSQEFSRNFRQAQQNFAYSADKMMETFVGLQKMSTTTGVSFDSLAGAFGNKLDTFRDSATLAGKLNQILGKSAFNSMELLTMTEVERAETVRNAIMESGRSVEKMGKFELLALNRTLGLGSVEETRRFLRGDLKIDEKGLMKGIAAKDPAALKTKNLDQQTDALAETFKKTLPPVRRYGLEIRKSSRRLADAALLQIDAVKNLQKLNFTQEQALLTYGARMIFPGGFAKGPTGKSVRDRGDLMGAQFDASNIVVAKAMKTISDSLLKKSKEGDLSTKEKTLLAGVLATTEVAKEFPKLSAAIGAQTAAITGLGQQLSSGVDIEVNEKGKGKAKAVTPPNDV